jgi:septal ring factor EnvC (AmiA/AmiB activator)
MDAARRSLALAICTSLLLFASASAAVMVGSFKKPVPGANDPYETRVNRAIVSLHERISKLEETQKSLEQRLNLMQSENNQLKAVIGQLRNQVQSQAQEADALRQRINPVDLTPYLNNPAGQPYIRNNP